MEREWFDRMKLQRFFIRETNEVITFSIQKDSIKTTVQPEGARR